MILQDLTKIRNLKHMVDYAAENYGENPFCTYKTADGLESKTYNDFQAETQAVSRFLIQNGLKGAHAAIIASNSYAWLAAHFGIVSSGSVSVPLAAGETPQQLCKLVDFADCKAVFLDNAHKDLINQMKQEAPCVEYYILLDADGEDGILGFEDLLREYAGEYTEEPDGNSVCAIMFTSGTTGFPKGVMLTHRNFVLSATSVHASIPAHSQICVLPLHHAFCLTATIARGISNGHNLFMNDAIPNLLENIRSFKPDSMSVVPLIAKKLMFGALKFAGSRPDLTEQQAVKAFFGGNLNDIVCGGAPLEPELATRFGMTGVPVLNGYGMTECAPIIANNAVNTHRAGSVGKPIPCMDVVIRNGEVLVKGPSVFIGYYKNEKATAEAFTEDGYFKTGDLGYFDNDGFLFLTGRCKNLILLDNGENVSAEQLEDRFANEKAVKEVVCYGDGTAVVAEIFLDQEFIKENGITDIDGYMIDMLQRVNEGLSAFQRISRYVLREVPFRRNNSLKIVRDYEHKNPPRKINPPVTQMQKKVCKTAAEFLTVDEIGIDDNFFALGGDSLTSIEFALALNIEPQLIYDNPFFGLLAAKMEKMLEEKNEENESRVNDLIRETKGGTRSGAAKVVFVTGASGFLGAHVIYELLKQDVTIWALVRSRERFIRRMSYYFGSTDISKVHFVTGNVERKNLGLTNELYDSLTTQVDTVIHMAANVHHAGDYADLARTNVEGTKNIIEFAKKANAVLQHTSTVSLHGAGTVIEDRSNARFDEEVLYIGQHYEDNVYVHSKYEAERLVLEARREGLEANIFRMGNLTWRRSDGMFQPNADDNGFLHRIRAILKLGIVNDNMDKFPMDLTAVDEAASAVAALSLKPEINEIYHIINTNYISTRDLFSMLGVPCREASTVETIESIMANTEDRDIHVFEFYSLISARSENVDVICDFTADAMRECGLNWSVPGASYLLLGNHCLGFEPYKTNPVRSTGGTMTYIQKLFLGVLQDAEIPGSKVIDSVGCISGLNESASELGISHPLVITFDSAANNGPLKTALGQFKGFEIYTEIAGEPTLADADKILEAYCRGNCDGVIAVGGGSVLDLAKITALRAANPDSATDDICKLNSKASRCVPFIAVPTTAGTGSEATIYAVITDNEGKKKPFVSTKFIPDIVLLDAQLTVSVPKSTTAYTAIDALSHLVEASVSLYAPHFAEDTEDAPQAVADIFANLPEAVKNPENINARAKLLTASHKAGIAFRRAGTGYIHAIAHRIGEIYHIPHGLAIASVFTAVLNVSKPYMDAPLSCLARACGIGETSSDFINAVDHLIADSGIDVSQVKADRNDIEKIVMKAQDEARITGYPKPFSDDALRKLIEQTLI
ncbi:MAG: iron-containing alcohol dehydrogenase [Clostridia bacterium]|nr:iron-containing alcohol dehydrogenase [Clostridia bacterium]